MVCSSGVASDPHQTMAPRHRPRQTESHVIPQGLLELYEMEFSLCTETICFQGFRTLVLCVVRKREVLSGLGTAVDAVSLQGQQRRASKTYHVRDLVATKSITDLMCFLAFWPKILAGIS